MNRSVRGGLAAIAVLAVGCGGGDPPPPPAPPVPVFTAQGGYARVASEIVDWRLARDPALATAIGEHEHDARLVAVFAGDLERAGRDARALLTRLGQVNRPTLARADQLDYRVMDYGLRAELHDLEQLAGWQRDPVRYVAALEEGVLSVYASDLEADARLRAAAARLAEAPQLYRAARQNLEIVRVPPLFARRAVADARALARRITTGDDAPGSASASPQARADWEAARRVAAAATDSFATWVEQSVLPSARGDFRIGATALRDLLLYEHHVDMPLDVLHEINWQGVVEYREWMERLALEMDPMRPPVAIMDSLVAAVPDAGAMIPRVLRPGDPPRSVSLVRRAFPPSTLLDSWAHYVDLAALETESTGHAERLAGIRRALHAHALLRAAVRLHAGDAPLEEVAGDIAAIAHIGMAEARREAERVAYDPGYGLAALGRMQIFAFRERMRAESGAAFDARAFADELLALGLPIPLAAEAMLGRDPNPLLVAGLRTPGVPEPPRLLD